MLFNVPLYFFMAESQAQKVVKRLLANDELAGCLLGGGADAGRWLLRLDTRAPFLLTSSCLCVLVTRCVVRYLSDVVNNVNVVVL